MTRAVSVAQIGTTVDGTANLNIDANTLFIDVVNNRVGIANGAPDAALKVTGTINVSSTAIFGGSVGVGVSPGYAIEVSGSSTTVASRGWSANTTQTAPMHFMAQNVSGTGDTNVVGYTFQCTSNYATHMHLRADGYLGAGGWSASTWRWYCNMGTGDFTAAGNVTAYSDPRLKRDVKKIDSPLQKVFALNGVRFRWVDDSVIGHPGKYDYGVLADEVQAVMPEIVHDSIADSPDGDRYKTVAYDKMIPLLIEAIKEQQGQIEALREELRSLKVCSCPT